jgi:hypothetical protein
MTGEVAGAWRGAARHSAESRSQGVLTEDRPTVGVAPGRDRMGPEAMRGPSVEADPEFERHVHRRRAAEAAAAEAESAAAAAAARAAVAIATAARAAEEAEAAADAAARAVEAAAVAEQRAAARATPQSRGVAPDQRRAGPPISADLPMPVPVPGAAAAPLEGSPDAFVTLAAPVAEGRAARRRAAEVADAETAVLPMSEFGPVDPDPIADGAAAGGLDVADREPAVDDAVATAAAVPAAAERPRTRRADRRRSRGLAARLTTRPVLAVAAVAGVLAIAAGIATFAGSGTPFPSPAAVVGAAAPTTAPVAPGAEPVPRAPGAGPDSAAIPRRGDVDPQSEKAVAYLSALREADIPTSRTGLAETEAAAVICEQLGQGADEAALVRALPAVLPTVTRKQAGDVVAFAQEFYC